LGQEVQVVILEIDETKNRISLSTKVLESHPGELLENFEGLMASAPERFEKMQAKLVEPEVIPEKVSKAVAETVPEKVAEPVAEAVSEPAADTEPLVTTEG
jgi:ribosomal protein S1